MTEPTSPFSPHAFLRQLIDAVLPCVDVRKGEVERSTGRHEETTYRAIAPLLGHFTVADAALLLPALYAASCLSSCEPEDDARYRIRSLVESFIADASASTAACVAARAYVLSMPTDDRYEHASEFAVDGMRWHLPHDLRDLRDGKFHGDRFGSGDMKKLPVWLQRSMERFAEFRNAA